MSLPAHNGPGVPLGRRVSDARRMAGTSDRPGRLFYGDVLFKRFFDVLPGIVNLFVKMEDTDEL